MGNRTFCGPGAEQCVDHCTKVPKELRGEDVEPPCDPAGAVFTETLVGMSPLDQEALRFASLTNLAAIRWLLSMGANPRARDRNGTTMLHAACRSGSCSIVQELVINGLPLDMLDVAGWTPLHIAAMVGRYDICALLLEARARLESKNRHGKTPFDLCTDQGTKEVLEAAAVEEQGNAVSSKADIRHRGNGAVAANWLVARGDEYESEAALEPFFVPRLPVFHDIFHRKEIVQLGIHMLNRSPGHGLGFLVAAGVVHDHPTDLSSFVLRHGADPVRLGEFLGEDFSIAQTLRLAHIHCIELRGTGVVGALLKVFQRIRAPPELRKVDRLTSSIAQLWWKSHELEEWEEGAGSGKKSRRGGKPRHGSNGTPTAAGAAHRQEGSAVEPLSPDGLPGLEVEGHELRQSLTSVEGFRRLMFSTVLLCWNLRAAPGIFASMLNPRRLSLNDWVELNAGIEADGTHVPLHVQRGIYEKVLGSSIQQLLPDFCASSPPVFSEREQPMGLVMDPSSTSLSGWATIPQGGLERLDPAFFGAGVDLARCIVSETTGTPSDPLLGRPLSGPGVRRTSNRAGERVWLAISHTIFLFLSASPADPAPYAFIRLQDVVVRDADRTIGRLVLAGKPKSQSGRGAADGELKSPKDTRVRRAGSNGSGRSSPTPSFLPFGDPRLPLPLCFLVADGRFQPVEALWLELQFDSGEDVDRWAHEITTICESLEVQETASRAVERVARLTGPKRDSGPSLRFTEPQASKPPPAPPESSVWEMEEEEVPGSHASTQQHTKI